MAFRMLVKSGIIRINKSWLDRRYVRKEIDDLEFALVHGLYNIRELAAKYLGELQSEESSKLLILRIDDPVPAVSEAVMQALESIGISAEVQHQIETKRIYWEQLERDRALKDRSGEKKYMPERKDRPSRKSFENLKQMLRKPMNSGKWF